MLVAFRSLKGEGRLGSTWRVAMMLLLTLRLSGSISAPLTHSDSLGWLAAKMFSSPAEG